MSDSRYEFHQKEVESLKSAAIYTLAVCNNLKRMLEGIRDDQPRFASRGIHELLDPSYHLKTYVDKVDHLLAPVKIPVNVPIRSKMHRGSDGIRYEDMFPQVIELREEPIAHLAAWVIHDTVVSYLWKVWRRGNPGLVYCDALEATYDLVGPKWPEIRQELSGFVEYDYYSLRKAIENESKAAIERCRQTIVGKAMTDRKIEPELRLVVGDGESPQATVDGKAISITKKQAELLRFLIEARGEYVSLAGHSFRSRDVEGLPDPIRKFVETQPGAGTRIPLDKPIGDKDI
jgi:hypothetical protein